MPENQIQSVKGDLPGEREAMHSVAQSFITRLEALAVMKRAPEIDSCSFICIHELASF